MSTVLLRLEEPPTRRDGFALWALGFRPFYLLAALQALLMVPLWALQFSGWLPTALLKGSAWHAHEMVFGYALAVVIGFLFTAGRNWSGQATPTGRPLQAIAALWVLARLAVLSPWAWLSLLLNVAVPWAAAWGLWQALHKAGNRRNYFFVGLLLMMGLGSALLHLGSMGLLELPRLSAAGLPLGLDIVLFMIAVMAGRVVPMFSNNGVPGMQARREPWVEQASLGSVIALLVLDALGVGGGLSFAVLCLALLFHSWRLLLWQPWKTWRNPLVWVLHAAYLWLPVHLLLRIAALLWQLPSGPATHALTVGVIGMITLGMITRTALGHTGRRLQAGPVETIAYLSMFAAALVRVVLPLAVPQWLMGAALASSLLWSLSFALYLWRYTPFLLRTRADGQPG
ncbi:NnrS family protein [Mitsuaria sp. WAJ17]|uniref:NnrS family protein n=1 Tax=Mitsuaria sp. WAJ17 TaxID=2761452 RepID=UPI00160103A0|nr:NnrS family protein [Mitsuaria sp. WAJ17]MBB2484168.1 NnrS family protein [Mitsuaria sp. WAJ17]